MQVWNDPQKQYVACHIVEFSRHVLRRDKFHFAIVCLHIRWMYGKFSDMCKTDRPSSNRRAAKYTRINLRPVRSRRISASKTSILHLAICAAIAGFSYNYLFRLIRQTSFVSMKLHRDENNFTKIWSTFSRSVKPFHIDCMNGKHKKKKER